MLLCPGGLSGAPKGLLMVGVQPWAMSPGQRNGAVGCALTLSHGEWCPPGPGTQKDLRKVGHAPY